MLRVASWAPTLGAIFVLDNDYHPRSWADNIDNKARQLAFNYDCMHGVYGTICKVVISSDRRFLRRLSAAYYHIGIETRTVLIRAGQIIEGDNWYNAQQQH